MSTVPQPALASVNEQQQVLCKTDTPPRVRSISPRELPIPVCIVEFYLGVTHCEPGNAYGCTDLQNRGLDLPYEITCWPKRRHYALTTGGDRRVIEDFKLRLSYSPLNREQRRICEIMKLESWELATFLRSWSVALQPKNLSEMEIAMHYAFMGQEPPRFKCKDCGHTWIATKKLKRCPHCDSAWWWNKPEAGQ